jgi:hypothetical protein
LGTGWQRVVRQGHGEDCFEPLGTYFSGSGIVRQAPYVLDLRRRPGRRRLRRSGARRVTGRGIRRRIAWSRTVRYGKKAAQSFTVTQ